MTRISLHPKTLSKIFTEARQQVGVSLDEAAKDLHIHFKYLEALEQSDFKNLPGQDYTKNLLRKYCQYLRIDFIECWKIVKSNKQFSNSKKINKIDDKYFTSWPKIIRKIIIFLIIIGIVFFLFIKIENIFTAPFLEIDYPIDGSIISTRQITISGRSESEVELIINNREIFVDNNGNFEAVIDLQRGLNSIKISAKKRYSKIKEKEIELLFKDE